MSIDWRPIDEFSKVEDGTEYLFCAQYQAYEWVFVGKFYSKHHEDGSVIKMIDTGLGDWTGQFFRHVTHFAEINLPDEYV